MSTETDFGVLLPHFGEHCTRERLLSTAKSAEELGFDSVWVRDHLHIPRAHAVHGGVTEDVILDPLMTLAAISSVTSSVTLGTNVVIPTRHPLKLSQNLGTLSFLSEGRVISGIGAGSFREEYEAIDLPYDQRAQVVRETFEILNRTMNEPNVSYDGEIFGFEDVTIAPQPVDNLPLLYGGFSPLGLRIAVDHADGWCPAKATFDRFSKAFNYLKEYRAESNADQAMTICPKALFSVHKEREKAIEPLNVEAMIDDVNRTHRAEHETIDDIAGWLIAGTPEECAADLQRFVDYGADHFILDLRHVFTSAPYVMELFVDEVLPRIDR